MISKMEFVNYLVDKLSYTYNEDKNTLIYKDDTEIDADKFFISYRKKSGQSFECIYDEHASLFSILKCTECGTYIFEHEDEDYEPRLKCPVCTDYKTSFIYYTAKDIEEDENKKKIIDMYLKMAQIDKEMNERYIQRGNLHDWERTHKHTIFNNKSWKADIKITGHFKTDLKAEINIWKKNDEISYIWKNHIQIPLSPYSFYILFIYKHLGKCHKDVRSKYYIGKARENI